MAEGNPLVILDFDGVEHSVQFDDVSARDVAELRPFVDYADVVHYVNVGPVGHDHAAAVLFLARRQAGEPVTAAEVFDSVKVTAQFSVRLAKADEASTAVDASPEA